VISSRVQEKTGLTDHADFAGDHIVDRTESGKWRLYEDGSGYSGTSGQTIAKGKVLRDENGRIRNFDSKAEAEGVAWILRDTRLQKVHNFKKERS
jgi:hypothetical protein